MHQDHFLWAHFPENTSKLIVLHVLKINLINQGPLVFQLDPFSNPIPWTILKHNMQDFKSIQGFKTCSNELILFKTSWKHGLKLNYEHACDNLPWNQPKIYQYKHACMILATLQHYKPYLGSNLQCSSQTCKEWLKSKARGQEFYLNSWVRGMEAQCCNSLTISTSPSKFFKNTSILSLPLSLDRFCAKKWLKSYFVWVYKAQG